MSTILADTSPLTLVLPSGQVGRLPQKHSWPTLTPVLHTIRVWIARRSQREALGELAEDKHLLADIGLTRDRALSEAAKPFWRT